MCVCVYIYVVCSSREHLLVYTYLFFFIPGCCQGEYLTRRNSEMLSRQKTFSMALSRDMSPRATLVVHCLDQSGEILADSLSFTVDGSAENKVIIL